VELTDHVAELEIVLPDGRMLIGPNHDTLRKSGTWSGT
jgi:hypothetical protein